MSVNMYQEIYDNTEEYDVFISYKRTEGKDEKGNEILTQDARELEELRNVLISKKGLKVFLAPYSIKNGYRYEPQIYAALMKAKVMVLYGSKAEYFSSQWVKNEWKRFLDRLNTNRYNNKEFGYKLNGSLIVVTNNVNATLLPKELSTIQCIDSKQIYSDINVLDVIVDRVNEYYKSVDVKLNRKDYKGVTYIKKKVNEKDINRRHFEKYDRKDVTASEESKLAITDRFLSMGNYKNVINNALEIINDNKSCSQAYYYLLLAENNVKNEDEFIKKSDSIVHSEYFDVLLATSEDSKCKKYVNVLIEKVKTNKNISDYNLLVTLPKQYISDNEINDISMFMFNYSVETKNLSILEEVLKTITDTDTYVKKLLDYGRKWKDVTVLNKVLEVDEGNLEALSLNYFINHKSGIVSSLSSFNELENLYKYGFNEYASNELFDICLSCNNVKKSANLFDFLIKMVPNNMNDLFISYLDKYTDKLVKDNQFSYVNKYLDLILSVDKLNDRAYVKKVLVKNKLNCENGLVEIIDNIIKDDDFNNAINAYAEKYPDKNNIYMNFYENSVYINGLKKFKKAYHLLDLSILYNENDKTVIYEEAKKTIGIFKCAKDNKYSIIILSFLIGVNAIACMIACFELFSETSNIIQYFFVAQLVLQIVFAIMLRGAKHSKLLFLSEN